MRVFAFNLVLSLLVVSPAEAVPRRAASLKLCTDELLLLLAHPEQVASVTYLAQQRSEFPLWQQARRYVPNDGSLLSVAAQRPDLVLDMGSSGRDPQRIARRLGVRMLNLPYPQTIRDVERSIALVSVALDRREAGRRLLTRIARLRRTAPAASTEAVWLGGGGRSLAVPGLGAEWMSLAGLRQRRLAGARLSYEELLVDPPPLVVLSNYRSSQFSMEQQWLSHPLLRQNINYRKTATDGRRWTCMGPLLIDEIERLRRVGRK